MFFYTLIIIFFPWAFRCLIKHIFFSKHSLNTLCFVLFMPTLCFIPDIFLLSSIIMHASFVFTKCILYLSGWLKEVLFLFCFYFDYKYSNITSFHRLSFTFLYSNISSVLLHTKKTTFICGVECECYLVLYVCIYLFFQSHYHT